MTPRQRQIYDAVQRLGSKTAAAKELQIDKHYVRRAYASAEAWLNADEGVVAALENTGLSTDTGKHGWRRVQNKETGSWDSVFWKCSKKPLALFLLLYQRLCLTMWPTICCPAI